MDLVGTLASVLGSEFAQLMPTFLPDMTQYYVSHYPGLPPSRSLTPLPIQDLERSTGDRSTTVGSLAEIVNGMEGAVTPFTDTLFHLFLRSLSDPEAEVRSNGAFAMGCLIFHSQTDLSSQYLPVLALLHPLFSASDDRKYENARDNACGAVARMVLKNIAAVPLDQVSSCFTVFPLWSLLMSWLVAFPGPPHLPSGASVEA